MKLCTYVHTRIHYNNNYFEFMLNVIGGHIYLRKSGVQVILQFMSVWYFSKQ